MKAAVWLALALTLIGCSSRQQQLPEGVIIFGSSDIAAMLTQCSRPAPEAGEGSWEPRLSEISALEHALPELLVNAKPSEDWRDFPSRWRREYVGIVRKGRRYLYGNYVSKPEIDFDVPGPTRVCDGGPPFFGAEWDVESRKVSHLEFNGSI